MVSERERGDSFKTRKYNKKKEGVEYDVRVEKKLHFRYSCQDQQHVVTGKLDRLKEEWCYRLVQDKHVPINMFVPAKIIVFIFYGILCEIIK